MNNKLINSAIGDSRSRPYRTGFLKEILPDEWGLPYLALLVYAFGMVTGRLPVGTVAVVIGLGALVFSRHQLRFAPPMNWMLLFLLWSCVGYLTTDFPAEVGERLFHFFKLVLVVFLTVNAVRTRKQAQFFLFAILIFFLLYPIRGTLLNFFVLNNTNFGRAVGVGIYQNSNDLAALTLLQMSVAASFFVGLRTKSLRLFALGAALIMALVIVLTQSRGVFLGGLAFAAYIVGSERRKLRMILIMISALILLALLAPASTFERFGKLTAVVLSDSSITSADEEGSAAGRSDVYRIALSLAADHPITGVGLGAYPLANERYATTLSDVVDVARGRIDAHSTYLSALAETGVPGLIIFLLLYRSVLRYIISVRRTLLDIDPRTYIQLGLLIAGIIGFLVAAAVGTYKSLAMTYVHLCAIWVYADAVAQSSERQCNGDPSN